MTEPAGLRMPFGKFRDKPVSEVFRHDPSYLAWFCDSVTGNDVVKQAIRALPGFPMASARYLEGKRRKAGTCGEGTDLPDLGVDPRLSREDLDRLCREILDLVTERQAARSPRRPT